MNKPTAKKAVSKIWALVYRSTQTRLSYDETIELEAAIGNLGIAIDADDLLDRKASFIHECAQMHVSALESVPPRKPQGAHTLVRDCEDFLKLLE